jgi:hypothetical protein
VAYKSGDKMPDDFGVRPDPLQARILMLQQEAGGDPLVFVALDCIWASETPINVKNPWDPVPDEPYSPIATLDPSMPVGTIHRWEAAAGLPKDSCYLSVHPTHTHYAPALTLQTSELIEKKIAEMRTSADWKAVTVHGGVVESNVCVSRVLGRPASDKIDKSLIVLDFRGVDDRKSVALIVNYGVHPIFLGDPKRPSADFVGVAMNNLEASFPVALFLQGWSGDLGPNYRDKPLEREYIKMRNLAKELSDDTLRAVASSTEYSSDRLKAEGFTTEFTTRMRGVDRNVTFRGFAIGSSIAIVAVSAEVFQDYGPILTRYSSKFMPSCGLANGYSGYIPTADGFKYTKSYEPNTSPFTPGVEGEMGEAFRKLFDLLG